MISTIVVYTSSWYLAYVSNKVDFYYMLSHLGKVFIGLVAFILGYSISLEKLKKSSTYIFMISIGLLILVLILPGPIAPNIRGAKRWINLFFLNFQISDLFRMAFLIFISFNIRKILELKNYFVYFFITLIGAILIAIEPNLSTASIIMILFMGVCFYIGVSITGITLSSLLVLSLGLLAIKIFPHASKRLSQTEAYQVLQSKIGLAHGGLWGVGIGEGKAKFLYLPDAHTDFIFSIIGEEMGFILATFITFLLIFLSYRGFIISRRLYKSGQLEISALSFGISFSIAIYTLGHISVVVGLLPPTGIPMPFISFGGSSLIINSFLLGILYQLSKT